MSHDPGFDLYQEGLSPREPRWKEAAIALGALVFSALGAWMLVDASGWKNKLTGLGCLPRKRERGDLQIPVSGLDHRPEKVVAYANASIAQAAATALESKTAR